MGYRVVVTAEADADLDEILSYLSVGLSTPGAATKFADELEGNYRLLEEHPYLFEQSRDSFLNQRGYRRFIIGNFVILYLVDESEQIVTIARLFYGKQDYAKYL